MKKLLALLFIATLACSCKKNGTSPAAEKFLISSENVTDYQPGDTANYQLIMTYNNHNMLTTVEDINGISLPVYYIYTYDENDNMLDTWIRDGADTAKTTGFPLDTTIFNYANGLPVSSSYTEYGLNGPQLLNTYKIANNKISEVAFSGTGNAAGFADITYKGNNFDTFTYAGGAITTYTYGTHNSPLLYTGYKYYLASVLYVKNDNEILEIRTVSATGQVDDQKFTYTYNSQGYPIKQVETDNGTPAETIVYSYKPEN